MLLAFDIGGTFIKYGLVDEAYQVSDSSKVPTPATIEDFWEALERVICSFQNQITGIAISCPGEINSRLGFVFKGGLIPYLRNIPLASRLNKMFQVPVTVLNDGDAAGLAEARIGNLQDCDCGATFVLGTGVGLALTSNGSLISTWNLKDYLRWPSLGEKQVTPEQKQYQTEILRHGISSLVQNLGSAVNFVANASRLLELPEEDGVQVFEVLEAGHHEELQDLFASYCREIAILIYNLQSLVRLEKVTIGGGISSQPLLLEEINHQYKS
ncbi:ROK family protein, partial [Streptococcus sp. IMAU11618]